MKMTAIEDALVRIAESVGKVLNDFLRNSFYSRTSEGLHTEARPDCFKGLFLLVCSSPILYREQQGRPKKGLEKGREKVEDLFP